MLTQRHTRVAREQREHAQLRSIEGSSDDSAAPGDGSVQMCDVMTALRRTPHAFGAQAATLRERALDWL